MFIWELGFVFIVFFVCVEFVLVVNNLKVILVCLGGFCWDYMSKVDMLNLYFIMKIGVYVFYVKNVFLMVMMLNFYIIVIGLYLENYGIIVNEMFDFVF